MKLLVFTDLHSDLKTFEKIASKAKKEKVDAIVCAGDFTAFSALTKIMIRKFESLKIPFFLVHGNHESPEEVQVLTKNLKFVRNVHLKGSTLDSATFIGSGGEGFSKENEEFNEHEKSLSSLVSKIKSAERDHKFIFMTHQPPYRTKLDFLPWAGYVGSKSARRFIEKNQPNLCVTGHIHETFGKTDKIGKTLIVNPGPEGKIVEI